MSAQQNKQDAHSDCQHMGFKKRDAGNDALSMIFSIKPMSTVFLGFTLFRVCEMLWVEAYVFLFEQVL